MAIVLKDSAHFQNLQKEYPLVIAYFTASWCGPCRTIAPDVDKLARSLQKDNVAVIVKIDVNDFPDIYSGYPGVPAFNLYKFGVKADGFLGADLNRLNFLISKHY